MTDTTDWTYGMKSQLYRKLYDKGMNDKEIAFECGRNANTIANWRLKNGLPPNDPYHHKIDEELALVYYNMIYCDKTIADKIGCTTSAVRKWRERNGFAPRARRGYAKRKSH